MSRGRDVFFKYKNVILLLSYLYKLLPLKMRKKIFEKKRYMKGNRGIALRYILLNSIAKQCGDNVSIHDGCYIMSPENLCIGDNVSIWPMTYIDAKGGVTIGSDVSIAHNVTLLSTSHFFDDMNTPIKDQGIKEDTLVIESNVWIGAKATVLYGITIKSGSILAAGTVVTHDVEENHIVGGIPARTIKNRGVIK